MAQVVLGENEGIESALRRFKRCVSKAGILADVKCHRHFETPLEKHKKAVARREMRSAFGNRPHGSASYRWVPSNTF